MTFNLVKQESIFVYEQLLRVKDLSFGTSIPEQVLLLRFGGRLLFNHVSEYNGGAKHLDKVRLSPAGAHELIAISIKLVFFLISTKVFKEKVLPSI